MMHSLLWTQTLLILLASGFTYYYLSSFDAMSAAYGGGIALFSSLILSRRVKKAVKSVVDSSTAEGSSANGSSTMTMLYIGVVQRYVFVLLGLGVGLALLKLNAKPLLIVFGISQLAYFMPWLGTGEMRNKD